MAKLWSIFTKNMDACLYTGYTSVERHHVFGGPNKARSEKYGFIAPLRPDLHPNGVHAGVYADVVDEVLKKACQRYYEANYGSREDFIKEFGKNYIGEGEENEQCDFNWPPHSGPSNQLFW